MDKAIETKGGRFYIAMGFNGFNLPANNGGGYATAARALAAAKRCGYRPGAVDPIAEMVATYPAKGSDAARAAHWGAAVAGRQTPLSRKEV